MTACPAGHDSVATDYCDVCGMRMEIPVGQATAAQAQAAESQAAKSQTAQVTAPHVTAPPPQAQLCPRCGATRSGRFCEGCGLDLDAPMPPASAMPPVSAMPPADPPITARPDPGAGPGGAGEKAGLGADPASYGTAVRAHDGAGDSAHGTGGDRAEITPGPGAGWSVVASADRAYYDTVTASGGPDAALVTFPAYCPERRFALTGPEMRIGRRSASRGLTPEIDLTGPPLDPGISRLHAVLIASPGPGWSVIDPGSENGTLVNGSEIATGVPVPLHDGDHIHLGAWTVITVSTTDSRQT
ncbi:MAG TPA: FHA domain-containing protein [Streptosporangiaceae bacterium]|nr:FHA domain-containing protein [Streptosporangiaceae bacterium]